MALPPAATATALGLAASFASGVKANFGTMTKPLHVGHCSRNGLFAALLAADGFTANAGALEHRQGFLHVFNGAGNFDAEAILREWGNPWDIVQPGVAIKQYPCCGSTHPAVDAMLALVREHGLTAGDGGTRRVPGRIRGAWRTPTARTRRARSMPNSACRTCLARALLDGCVALQHFDGDSHREPAIRALLPRIHAAPQNGMPVADTEHFGAEVRVTLTDGRILSAQVARPLGRGPTHPLPAALLEAKFLDCAARALPMPTAVRLLAMLRALDEIRDLRRLTEAMASAVALAAD